VLGGPVTRQQGHAFGNITPFKISGVWKCQTLSHSQCTQASTDFNVLGGKPAQFHLAISWRRRGPKKMCF
jgi:hypothetical protein